MEYTFVSVSPGSLAAVTLTRAFASTIAPFLLDLQNRSRETHTHSKRVGALAVRVGFALNLSETELCEFYLGAALHDVGKLFLDTDVLHKPGKLDPDELAQVCSHPARGDEYLTGFSFAPTVLAAARSHHERWDGTGYPDGLAGPEIPLVARVVAVVDTFDTVVSNRAYDPPRRVETAHS